jgi:ABC-type sugar transport system ATPase subunit
MGWLELSGIEKSFKNTSVLKEISLQALEGEFVVLLGPSGCGKSTLLRIIAGLEPQTSGTISIGGRVVDHLSPRDRDIAMVFQQYALYPHLTVRENLAFGLKMRKEAQTVIEERIKEAADLLEIHDLLDRLPKELSGGQRQRVAMGRAIVRKPKLFLFDEPLSNLDARLRTSLRVELKKLHERLKTTMIYVTHDQVEAMTLGQKIMILNEGKIQQIGTSREIYEQPENPFVAGFIGNPPMNIFQGRLKVKNGVTHFQSGDLNIPLPLVSISSESTETYWGVRPEDIQLESFPTPAVTLSGTVEVVENLGADVLLYVNVFDQRMVMRTPRTVSKAPGDAVVMQIPENRQHVFVDKHRLEWASDLTEG